MGVTHSPPNMITGIEINERPTPKTSYINPATLIKIGLI